MEESDTIMKKSIYCVLLSIFALALQTTNSFGQATASGNVQGTVTDSSQAVVTGAQVELSSVSTGAKRSVVTSTSGSYRFDLLPAGHYKVTVSSPSFSTVVESIELLGGVQHDLGDAVGDGELDHRWSSLESADAADEAGAAGEVRPLMRRSPRTPRPRWARPGR